MCEVRCRAKAKSTKMIPSLKHDKFLQPDQIREFSHPAYTIIYFIFASQNCITKMALKIRKWLVAHRPSVWSPLPLGPGVFIGGGEEWGDEVDGRKWINLKP